MTWLDDANRTPEPNPAPQRRAKAGKSPKFRAIDSVAFHGWLVRLRVNELRVLAYLWAAANGDGIVKAGSRLIAGAVGADPKTVREALTGLADKKLVRQLHRGKSRRDRSVWRLLIATRIDDTNVGAQIPHVDEHERRGPETPRSHDQTWGVAPPKRRVPGTPADTTYGKATASADAPPPRFNMNGTGRVTSALSADLLASPTRRAAP